ncbi:MAG: aldehyde ferredoxin oxidoreductase family protein [Methanosarcinaceae archaeon]
MENWTGKTVHVDLSSESIRTSRTDGELKDKFLGGRGLGVKLLFDLTDPGADPLGPENPLIFTSGPLTGLAPMAGRFVLTSKSPLTGTVFSWNAGGNFGQELKKEGIDALVVTGMAKKPVYIELGEGNVAIKNAGKLWGKNTEECTGILGRKGSVACIGRAGEKLVRISSFVCDSIHSGRGGLGAVAGSKMLKAVVVKGKGSKGEEGEGKGLTPADPEGFKEAESKVLKLFEANPVLSKGLANYGTPVLVKLLNYLGLIPCRNFLKSGTAIADRLSGEYIRARFELEKESCPACPLGCMHRIKSTKQLVPGYDGLWAFGLNLENPDFESVLRASRICTEYGLDPVSAGSVLGAYAELESCVLDSLKIETLLLEIGEGQSELGKGALEYLSARGRKELSMDVKGLEMAGFDPRGIRGQALAYATSPHGADYLTAFMVGPEVLGKPLGLDRLSLSGKSGVLQVFENLTALLDSLSFCPYSVFALNEGTCSDLLLSATGKQLSPAELLKIGEGIWNLERLFNLKAGFTRADDTLPERLLEAFGKKRGGKGNDDEEGDRTVALEETVAPEGNGTGIPLPDFETALLEYYHFRGWDDDGVPLARKLEEVGLRSRWEHSWR